MNVRTEFHPEAVMHGAERGSAAALRRSGAYLRRVAQHDVFKSAKSSLPGTPPHTRRGLLKNSILFGVAGDQRSVVVGPAYSFIGLAMTAHEYGGKYRGRNYPRRPLMGPALQRCAPHLNKFWDKAVKP